MFIIDYTNIHHDADDTPRSSVSTACDIWGVLVGPEISEEIVESVGLAEERDKRFRFASIGRQRTSENRKSTERE